MKKGGEREITNERGKRRLEEAAVAGRRWEVVGDASGRRGW